MRLFVFIVMTLTWMGGVAPAQEAEKPKLTLTVKGKDLIVTSTVTVNNSPHVAWTHAIPSGSNIYLYYQIIQNRDLLVREGTRSRKQVELKWKVPNATPAGKSFHIRQEFMPNSAELKQLLPELEKLAAGKEDRENKD